MFHAGYGLLKVKEWGRWESPCFHGYLRYDKQTVRHVGKKMAFATGSSDYTKPIATDAATFRSGGKKKSATTPPQSNYPEKCNIPSLDISDALMVDIRKAVHLWRLVGNPETTTVGDLRFFDNNDAIFYDRQGRLFVRELLPVGNCHLARKLARSAQRRNRRLPKESSVVEFNRLRRDLETFFYGDPTAAPGPFRIKQAYKHPATKGDELTKLEVEIRQWKIKCDEESAERRLLNMYGASGFFRIVEMTRSGELEIWLRDRFGTPDFPVLAKCLRSANMAKGEKRVTMVITTARLRHLLLAKWEFCRPICRLKLKHRKRSEMDPSASSTTRPVAMKAPPKELIRIDECACLSASHRKEPIDDLSSSASMGESDSAHSEEFRAGGAHRTPSSPKTKSAKSDDGNSRPISSASDVSPSPP